MADLKCSVESCLYNEDHLCSKGDKPFLLTAQGTHTFSWDKPLICVE